MSESSTHIELVKVIYKYVEQNVQPNHRCLICADMPGTVRPSNVIGNYIPDLSFWHEDVLIIGEAKTKNDVLRPHSQAQYKAYLNEAKAFYGKAILIIGVQWDMALTVKNYFSRLKVAENYKIDIIVINELGKTIKI